MSPTIWYSHLVKIEKLGPSTSKTQLAHRPPELHAACPPPARRRPFSFRTRVRPRTRRSSFRTTQAVGAHARRYSTPAIPTLTVSLSTKQLLDRSALKKNKMACCLIVLHCCQSLICCCRCQQSSASDRPACCRLRLICRPGNTFLAREMVWRAREATRERGSGGGDGEFRGYKAPSRAYSSARGSRIYAVWKYTK